MELEEPPQAVRAAAAPQAAAAARKERREIFSSGISSLHIFSTLAPCAGGVFFLKLGYTKNEQNLNGKSPPADCNFSRFL